MNSTIKIQYVTIVQLNSTSKQKIAKKFSTAQQYNETVIQVIFMQLNSSAEIKT